MEYRTERDSLGERNVPADAYYGIQTLRATENFPVSGRCMHPQFIRAYLMIKKACATTHMELGSLDTERGRAILQACDEALAGRFADQWMVDVYQAGAGTSFNMNVNEVLANRALEILGRERGNYGYLSPNDHVNLAQSTNDTFPTAMHISTLFMVEELVGVLDDLASALEAKGKEFAAVIKSARTHLQDAVPITLGQEFLAYGAAIGRARDQIVERSKLLEEVALGGTAAGTGVNAPPLYRATVIRNLGYISGLTLSAASDSRAAMQSFLPTAAVSSGLKELALELIRVANDLRLLSSGPRTGLAEIGLPPVQPGSSMMPGKVNPVMAECLDMIAYQVVGNDLTISMAVQAGQLDFNVMMPVMIHNLLESIEILKNFLPVFIEKCVRGISADTKRCRGFFEQSIALATLLSPRIGYLKAAELAKEAEGRGTSVVDVVLEKGILSREELEKILDPEVVTGQRPISRNSETKGVV
ncbi:MAG: aspartate ammonia-lyase [bacterium]